MAAGVTTAENAQRPQGAILAGGAARRMGRDKRLVTLAGRSLLDRVVERFASQVARVVLSVERPSPQLAGLGLPQLTDPLPGHRGPLGGLLAALEHFQDPLGWLALVPCDAPFLPTDLVARLWRCARRGGASAAVVAERGEWQPTFSIWHGSLLPAVQKAVDEGQGGFRRLLQDVDALVCDWPGVVDGPPPFFNVNDAATLLQAEEWLRSGLTRGATCSA